MLNLSSSSSYFKNQSKQEFRSILRNLFLMTIIIDEHVDKSELILFKKILSITKANELTAKNKTLSIKTVDSVEQLFSIFRIELNKLTEGNLQELAIQFILTVIKIDGVIVPNEEFLIDLIKDELPYVDFEKISSNTKELKNLLPIIMD